MQTRQGYALEGLRAVQQFLADNAARLGAVADSGARHRLDQVISDLATCADEQAVGTIEQQMATRTYHARREELVRLQMAAIVAAARLEAPRVPELGVLRMPRGNIASAKLASEAMGMASMAESHEAVFIAAGLPTDFIKELRAVTTDMSDTRVWRHSRRASVGGATTGIRSMLTTGRRLVALLDKLIRRQARADIPLLIAWEAVKQAHRIGRRVPTPMLGQGTSVPALANPGSPRMLSAGDEVASNRGAEQTEAN